VPQIERAFLGIPSARQANHPSCRRAFNGRCGRRAGPAAMRRHGPRRQAGRRPRRKPQAHWAEAEQHFRVSPVRRSAAAALAVERSVLRLHDVLRDLAYALGDSVAVDRLERDDLRTSISSAPWRRSGFGEFIMPSSSTYDGFRCRTSRQSGRDGGTVVYVTLAAEATYSTRSAWSGSTVAARRAGR
jgi:hypothetical protein